MQLNPTKADIEEAAKAYEAKGADTIKPLLKEKIGEIEAVHEQLSESYDWSKVTKLDGTSDDKRNAFRKMNADMCALRDRMREIQGIEASLDAKDRAEEIAERNGGSRPANPRANAEAERLAQMPPSDRERHNSTRFLRMAAEQAGIELTGDGKGKDSIVWNIAQRNGGVEKINIPLDYLIGPRAPQNVLTGGGPGSGGATGGGSNSGGADGGWSIYPPMTDLLIEQIWPPILIMDVVRRLSTRSNLYVYRKQTNSVPQIPIAGDADRFGTREAAGWVERTPMVSRSSRSGRRRLLLL